MSSETLKCLKCEKNDTFMWYCVKNGQICYNCHEKEITQAVETINNCNDNNDSTIRSEIEGENSNGNSNNKSEGKKVRKSTRSTRFKPKNVPLDSSNKAITKGRGRRWIFKKNPVKSPTMQAETYVTESVFHKGLYIQIGDIVSLTDEKENLYYGQIKGLLVDRFCEKFACITWLLPTKLSPKPNDRFDPSTYILGPEEDFLRNLSCMEFVMHAPSTYFHDKTTPYPPPDFMNINPQEAGYIWTRLTEEEKEKPLTEFNDFENDTCINIKNCYKKITF